jgi:hypothetical protein
MLIALVLNPIDFERSRVDIIEFTIGLVWVVEVYYLRLHWIGRVKLLYLDIKKYAYHCYIIQIAF